MIRTYYFRYVDPGNDIITEVSFCAETYKEATKLFYDFVTDEHMIFDPPILRSWTESNQYDAEWASEEGEEYDISDQRDVFIDCDDRMNFESLDTFEDREILSDIYLMMVRRGGTPEEIERFKDIYRMYTVNTDDRHNTYVIPESDYEFVAQMLMKYCFKRY